MKLKVRRVVTIKKYYVDEVEYNPDKDYLGDIDGDLPMVEEDIVDDNTTVWRADTMELYSRYSEGDWV